MSAYARNRRATHDYQLHERFEAGIALQGWEVKAIVAGQAQLSDCHVVFRRGEAWLINCHLSPAANVDQDRIDQRRSRKLLLHAKEIYKMSSKVKQTGLSVIALALYRKHGKIKVEIALAKGKKRHDKRRAIKERELRREHGR